jgi:Family of unknown function (DUF6194)
MTIPHSPEPDPETIATYIMTTFPNTDVVTIEGGSFFSLDPERHFPNFATIVWTDEFDQASNLSRPGFFRLNIGLSRATFERLVGSIVEPDYKAVDVLLPHPDYARQHYVSIVNPSAPTFEELIVPLLAEAHDRLAAQRARHAK